MDATKLRIGNFIHNNVESFQIQAKDLVFLLAFDNEHYAEPIRLTDEWLVKLGGDVNPISTGITYGRFRLIWKEAYKYWYVVDKETQCYISKVEFVHEWQNLVAAMDGNELTVKA